MSRFLHIFPASDPLLAAVLRIAKPVIDPSDVPSGRAPSQEEFDAALKDFNPGYDIDKDGRMTLRVGPAEEMFQFLSSIVKDTGAQLILTDNMDAIIFTTSTDLKDFKLFTGLA